MYPCVRAIIFPSLDWLPNNQDKLVDININRAGRCFNARTIIDKTRGISIFWGADVISIANVAS